jgi:hypothetical protein
MAPMQNMNLLASVGENFMMKELPAEKQYTIW